MDNDNSNGNGNDNDNDTVVGVDERIREVSYDYSVLRQNYIPKATTGRTTNIVPIASTNNSSGSKNENDDDDHHDRKEEDVANIPLPSFALPDNIYSSTSVAHCLPFFNSGSWNDDDDDRKEEAVAVDSPTSAAAHPGTFILRPAAAAAATNPADVKYKQLFGRLLKTIPTDDPTPTYLYLKWQKKEGRYGSYHELFVSTNPPLPPHSRNPGNANVNVNVDSDGDGDGDIHSDGSQQTRPPFKIRIPLFQRSPPPDPKANTTTTTSTASRVISGLLSLIALLSKNVTELELEGFAGSWQPNNQTNDDDDDNDATAATETRLSSHLVSPESQSCAPGLPDRELEPGVTTSTMPAAYPATPPRQWRR